MALQLRPRFALGSVEGLSRPESIPFRLDSRVSDTQIAPPPTHELHFNRRPTGHGVSEPEQTRLAHGGDRGGSNASIDIGDWDRRPTDGTMGSGGGKRRGVGGGSGSGVVAPVVLLGSGAALWAALQQGTTPGAGGTSGTAELGAAAAKVRVLWGSLVVLLARDQIIGLVPVSW